MRPTKIILVIILIPVLIFLLFLAYATFTDYKPKPIENVKIEGTAKEFIEKDTFLIRIWNIGYAGLGKEADFFFDGGSSMRMSEELTWHYLKNIGNYIFEDDETDFFMLQEVDTYARRSYYINQYDYIRENLNNRVTSFAKNYDSKFVPQPLLNPLGRVVAGLMNIGKYTPNKATRYRLENDASYPVGLFMLKRCLLEWRYDLPNGKELVIINVHLSAYDDGSVKAQQMEQLRKVLEAEEALGNYVIVGGDWNQNAPKKGDEFYHFPSSNWTWIHSETQYTNRDLSTPLTPETQKNKIDYFLISNNLEVLDFDVDVQNFEFSDHEPLFIKVRLL